MITHHGGDRKMADLLGLDELLVDHLAELAMIEARAIFRIKI